MRSIVDSSHTGLALSLAVLIERIGWSLSDTAVTTSGLQHRRSAPFVLVQGKGDSLWHANNEGFPSANTLIRLQCKHKVPFPQGCAHQQQMYILAGQSGVR